MFGGGGEGGAVAMTEGRGAAVMAGGAGANVLAEEAAGFFDKSEHGLMLA